MSSKINFKEFFEDDHFQRCTIAENLTNIFVNRPEGIIISINSPWGTGKSKFLEMWKNGLDSTEDFKTIVLNAWEADYYNDPLFALLLAIDEYGDTISNVDSSDFGDAVNSIIVNLVKKGTFDVVDIQQIRNDLNSKSAKQIKINYKNYKRIANDLKESLLHIRGDKKVVFFIDEIDRAKPNFVVELIETIKHFFKLPGYYFVLMNDRQQFNSIIRHYYGDGISSNDYLRKIIDLDFSLPLPSSTNYYEILVEKENLNMMFDEPDYWTSDGLVSRNEGVKIYYLYKMLITYINIFEFSLRDVEKLVYYLKILLPNLIDSYSKNITHQVILSALLSYLISLRIKSMDAYQKLLNGNVNVFNDVLKEYPLDTNNLEKLFYSLADFPVGKTSIQGLIDPLLRKYKNGSEMDLNYEVVNNSRIKYSNFINEQGLIIIKYLDFANHFNVDEF